jgi:hypothetical protein
LFFFQIIRGFRVRIAPHHPLARHKRRYNVTGLWVRLENPKPVYVTAFVAL